MERQNYHFVHSEDHESALISVREIAEQYGLDYSTLMVRLEMGCPLPAAIQIPEEWTLLSVFPYGDDDLMFEIAKKTYFYRYEDCLRSL